jgi:hypothetical protein
VPEPAGLDRCTDVDYLCRSHAASGVAWREEGDSGCVSRGTGRQHHSRRTAVEPRWPVEVSFRRQNNERVIETYDGSKIKVLKGLDAVRKRPACTSAIRMTARACTTWSSRWSTTPSTRPWPATARASRSRSIPMSPCLFVDNGRGIPTDMHEEGVSAAEVIMTVLHAGRKVRRQHLQGVRRPARRRRFCRQRAVRGTLADHLARRQAYEQYYAHGVPQGPWKRRARRSDRHADSLQAIGRDLHQHRVRLRYSGQAPARAGFPEFRGRDRAADERTDAKRPISLRRWPARLRRLPQSQQDTDPQTFHFQRIRTTALASRWRCSGTTPTRKTSSATPTIFPSATAALTWPVSARR